MPEITVRQITTRLKDFLDPKRRKRIDLDDPFVTGGPGAGNAVVSDLNKRGPYRRDKIIFVPGTFDKATTIWLGVQAIIDTYRKADWKIKLGI